MNRRNFLAATVGGSLAGAATAHAQDQRGRARGELPTPALLVDLDRLESNLRTMAQHCQRAGCGYRPHAKTHKCPEIARRQVAAGALGICVATVPEAEAMIAAGIRGVLLTSPIVDPAKAARLAVLTRQGDLLVTVGHARQVELLDAAAQHAGITLTVLVDLDVGDRRTGVLPGPAALELGRLVARSRHLRLRGLQAYAGLASHVVGFERRTQVSRQALQLALETRDLYRRNQLEVAILSGGSTGTYNIDSTPGSVTELQVGSYVFMDVDYRRIGGQGNAAVYDDFQPSLTVLATVVSASHADRVTVDAGTKALDTTVPWRAEPVGRPGLSYRPAGDEFGTITAEAGARLPGLGERLELLVPHCDPTTNLFDRLYVMRQDRVEAVWPLVARREGGR